MEPDFTVEPEWCNKSSRIEPPQDSCIADKLVYEPDFVSGPKLTLQQTVSLCTLDPDHPDHVPGVPTENPIVPTIFETCDYDGNCQ